MVAPGTVGSPMGYLIMQIPLLGRIGIVVISIPLIAPIFMYRFGVRIDISVPQT